MIGLDSPASAQKEDVLLPFWMMVKLVGLELVGLCVWLSESVCVCVLLFFWGWGFFLDHQSDVLYWRGPVYRIEALSNITRY